MNCRDQLVVQQESNDPLAFHEPARARWGSECLKAMSEIEDHCDGIEFPFIIYHGSRDEIIRLEGSEQVYKRACSKDKELSVWPGLYHDMVNDEEGPAVLDHMASWVEARS